MSPGLDSSLNGCCWGLVDTLLRGREAGVAARGRPPGGPIAEGWVVRLYVGLRLTRRPRLGTKSEFWTFVKVPIVRTSGSEPG